MELCENQEQPPRQPPRPITRRRIYVILPHLNLFKIQIRSEICKKDKWYHDSTEYLTGYDTVYAATYDIARLEEWLPNNNGKGTKAFNKTLSNVRSACGENKRLYDLGSSLLGKKEQHFAAAIENKDKMVEG